MYDPYGPPGGTPPREREPLVYPKLPSAKPSWSADLGRRILAGELNNAYELPWYTSSPYVDLPDLYGSGRPQNGKPVEEQRPDQGFPQRLSLTMPWSSVPPAPNLVDQSMTDLFGPGSALGTGFGAVPGTQRGGAIDVFGLPVATTPATLTNFSSWGREGLLALIDSVLTGGNYITPEGDAGLMFDPETGVLRDPNRGPTENRSLVDELISAIKVPFDAINNVYEGALEFWRTENAKNRALNVINLGATGNAIKNANEVISIDWITSQITGGAAKFDQSSIERVAAERGMEYDEMVAEYYDLPVEVVRELLTNGEHMTGDEVRSLVHNMPLSRNPAVNMALELGINLATLLVPIGAAPRLAAMGARGLGLTGKAAPLVSGLSGARTAAQGASNAERALQMAGWGTRRLMQVNSINNAAGWSIRGMEWGIKQVAVLGGNTEVVAMMDQLLWNMPLSMNPGINIVTAFSSHPAEALGINIGRRGVSRAGSGLIRGSIDIGKPGTVGYVGVAGRQADGTWGIRIGAEPYTLPPGGEKLYGDIRAQTLDDWMPGFFEKLGIQREWMDTAFGEGNVDNLTLDDLREFLGHAALTAHRDTLSPLERARGLSERSYEARTKIFLDQNVVGAHRLFQQELAGESSAISDAIKGQWWRYADLNDTDQSPIKARFQQEWQPDQGFQDMLSAIKVDRLIRTAYAAGHVTADTVARFTENINVDWLRTYRDKLVKLYPDPKERVAFRDIDPIKRFGGMVEKRGLGGRLVRRGNKQVPPTQKELLRIIDSVIEDENRIAAEFDRPPREDAPIFREGADIDEPIEIKRALRISGGSVEAIRAAEATPPENLGNIAIPRDVARIIAERLSTTVDALMADPVGTWPKIIEWFNEQVARADASRFQRRALETVGQVLLERRGKGADQALMDAGIAGAAQARDYLLNPVEFAYLQKNEWLKPRLLEAERAVEEVAGKADELGRSPFRNVRFFRRDDGLTFPLPRDARESEVGALTVLIDDVATSGRLLEGDLEALLNPDLHPFLKLDLLRRANLTDEEQALVDGIDPNSLHGLLIDTLGPDTPFTNESIGRLIAGHDAWAAQLDDIAGTLDAIGRKYATLESGGSQAPDTLDLRQRLEDLELRSKQPWRNLRMSTEEDAPLAQRAEREKVVREQDRTRRQVAQAEQEYNAARDELNNLTRRDLTPDFDRSQPYLKVRKGGEKAAIAQAKQINAATGLPTTWAKVGKVYEVYVGRMVPRVEAAQPAATVAVQPKTFYRGGPESEMPRNATAADVVRYERDELGNADVVAEAGVDLDSISARHLQWVTETEEAAANYARHPDDTVRPQTYTNYRIVARDGEGGLLIEILDGREPRAGAEGAIQQAYDAGDIATGQALNVEEGVARGGTVESGGAVLAEAPAPRATGYFKGDKIEYVGTTQEIHGGTFYDAVLLEGPDAGKAIVVREPPSVQQATTIQVPEGTQVTVAEIPPAPIDEIDPDVRANLEMQLGQNPDVEVVAPLDVVPPDVLIVSGGSASSGNVPFARPDEPAFTIKANPGEPIRMLIRGENQDSMRPLGPDEPAATITANKSKGPWRAVMGERVVRVTSRALARLQGIPDNYVLPDNEALARTIIGNGVPPPLMKAVVDPLIPFMGKSPRGFTMFSGGGIAELGIKDQIRFMGAVEYDPKIAAVHTQNHPESRMQNVDVREAQFSTYQGIDYLHASPVCKNFSAAKAQRGELELDIETARATAKAIDSIGPQVVTVENVPRYQGSEALKIITDKLDERGYSWDITVFDAADYGVPQHRKRMLLRAVSGKRELPPLPEKQPQVGWYQAIADLDLPDDPKGLAPWQVRRLEKAGVLTPAGEAPTPATYGTSTDFPIPGEETTRVPARFRLMEIDELVADTDKGYDAARLQPRQRSRNVTSDQQIRQMAKKFDPELALRTESGSHGPAVIDSQGQVIAGNGRTRAMREMSDAQFTAYKEALKARSDEFGLTPGQIDAMNRPVLVREVGDEYANMRTATALNVETGRMRADEIARAMAADITADDLALLDLGEKTTLATALGAAKNQPFVQRLLGLLNPQQADTYRAADGSLNSEGVRVFNAAILQKVLRDPDGALIETMLASDDFLRLRNGIEDTLGQLAQVEAAVERGELGESLSGALRGAIEEYRSLREQGLPPTMGKPQTLGFGDPLALDLGWALYQMPSRQEVASFFRAYAKAALEQRIDTQTVGMFGDATPAPDIVRKSIQAAIQELNAARRSKAGFFEGGTSEIAQVTDPDGTAPTRFTTQGGAESMARDVPVFESNEAAIDARLPAARNVVVSGNPLDPTTYAGAEKAAGEVVFHGGPERYALAVQRFFDHRQRAVGEYGAIIGQIERGEVNAAEVFDANVGMLNADNPQPYTLLLLDALSMDGLRFNTRGEFNGRFNPNAALDATRHDALAGLLPYGRTFRATHQPPDLTPDDAAILNSPVNDAVPFFRGAPEVVVDQTPERTVAQGAIESGASTFVKRGGTYDDVAREITGASKAEASTLLHINPPDEAKLLRLAQERFEAAEAKFQAARAEADQMGAVPPEPQGRPNVIEPLDPTIDALLWDYVLSPGMARAEPTARSFAEGNYANPRMTVGQVMDVIDSLDQGIPSLGVNMSEAEMATLRQGLVEWVARRLETEPGVAGPRAQRAQAANERRRVKSSVLNSPEEWHEEVQKALKSLERVVKPTDDGPITGYEGIQYDLGHVRKVDKDGNILPGRVTPAFSFLEALNRVSPDLPSELAMGRKQDWPSRIGTARLAGVVRQSRAVQLAGRAADIAFGGRNERDIHFQTVQRFEEEILGPMLTPDNYAGDVADNIAKAQKQIGEIVTALHDWMSEPNNVALGGIRVYRSEYLIGPGQFERIVREHLVPAASLRESWAKNFIKTGQVNAEAAAHIPDWAQAFMGRQNIRETAPFWNAWRKADNRIRAFYAGQENGVTKFLERFYDSGPIRRGATGKAKLTHIYHTFRFMLDVRWRALEYTEAPTLVFFREGVRSMLEGMGIGVRDGKAARTGRVKPMFMGEGMGLDEIRGEWAWWLQNDYIGGSGSKAHGRENYVLSMVKRTQLQDFPKVMRQMAEQDPSMAAILRQMGDTPDQWLQKLNDDWELFSAMGKEITEFDAERIYGRYLENGTISQKEYDKVMDSVRAGQSLKGNEAASAFQQTRIPALERAIAENLANPVLTPLLERLKFINEQAWNDAAQVVFGQVDRSNFQRLMNSPLLYWPISYQIKATKWLAGLMFDRAFGVDTGSLGALVLDRLHQQHQVHFRDDEEYREFFRDNETLLFFAQMLMPLTPFDIGVSLSPFTRLALEDGYNRNVFSIGPGYTFFNLIPRVGWTLRKSGFGPAEDLGELIGKVSPFTITVGETKSEQQRQTQVQPPPPAAPFEAPSQRYQEGQPP